MHKIKAFTLIELIIVVVLIGILVSLAMPNYLKKAEGARDQEAKVCLKLIQAAEKVYFMKHNEYYISQEGFKNADINVNLNLDLPANQATVNWQYWTIEFGDDDFRAIAQRINGPDQRQWVIGRDFDEPLEGVWVVE